MGPDLESTLEVTTCHCHHHLHQNTSPKLAHHQRPNGIAKGNQGPQPPGLGRAIGTLEVDPDPDLHPGTEVKGSGDSIAAVNTPKLGAAQDQEIGQRGMEITRQGLIDQVKLNTPTDECHMTTML